MSGSFALRTQDGGGSRALPPSARPPMGGAAGMLALQRTAGNRAMQQLVQPSRPAPAAPRPRPTPPAAARPRPTVQRYTVVPWGNFVTANARFATQVKIGQGFTTNGSPNIAYSNTPALRVSQNGQLAVQDANLGQTQPKVMFASATAIKSSNAALMRSGGQFILIGDATKTVTVTVAGATFTLQQVVPIDVAAGLGGWGGGAGEHPPGTTGALEIAQKCNETVQEVTGGPSDPSFLDPTFNVPQKGSAGYYGAEGIAPTTGAGQSSMANVNFSAAPHTNFPHMEGVADRYGRLIHGGGGDAEMRRLGANRYAMPKVGEGYFTESLGAGEAMVPGQNPNDPARQIDIADPYNNRQVRMPANQRNQRLWGFHYAGVVAEDGTDRITLENYARTAEGGNVGTSKDQQYYFQMYGTGAQSFHEAWAAIGHGGKEFVNPITMVVRRGGTDKAALDGSAARHFGRLADDPSVKDAYNDLAAAATADEQTVPMLKGLAYANAHVTGNQRGRRSRLKRWKTALANAPVFAETNALRARLSKRLGRVKKSLHLLG